MVPRHKSALDIASLDLGELLAESLPVLADLKEQEEEEAKEEEATSLKSFTILYSGVREQKYLRAVFFGDDELFAGPGVLLPAQSRRGESNRFELTD